MTKETIREAIKEMDCLERKETEILADMIFEANEKRTEEAINKAAEILDWLHKTDRITLSNYLNMRDLIF